MPLNASNSETASISADGTMIAHQNFGPGFPIHVSDTATGAPAPQAGDDDALISADGRYVMYDAMGGLTPGAGTSREVYVYNVETGTTTLLPQDAAGAPDDFAFDGGGGQSFSADDTKTTFEERKAGAANSIVVQATAATAGGTPTIALDPVAGDGFVDAAEAQTGATVDKVMKAQDDEGIQAVSGLDLGTLRSTFEAAGVEFRPDGAVWLRKGGA